MESAESRPGPLPAARPDSPSESLSRRVRFLRQADQLKGVLRQGSILDGSRKENSAEHSWHLALMALVLGDYAPPGTDLSRVSSMLLLHDLVEIDAGDLFVYADAAAQARQEAAEHAAADRLFALLPPAQGRELRALWGEFEERRTPEARFARALDRLQPMLANYYLGGGTWREHGIRASQVLDKVELIADGSAGWGTSPGNSSIPRSARASSARASDPRPGLSPPPAGSRMARYPWGAVRTPRRAR